jgi:DNA-binding protein H-NS
MATLEQIQARVKKLQIQAEALIAKSAQGALDQIRGLMLKHGLTTEDIEARAKEKRERARAERNGLSNGKAKVTSAAKGKLPPKYRDPKSGATWSGHARPPQWIKNAKDRTRFLIDAAAAASEPAVTAKVKAVAKKAAGKKAAVKKSAKSAKAATKVSTVGTRVAAKKTSAVKAVGKKTAAKKATAKRAAPAAAKKTVAKKAAVEKAAVKKAPVKKAAAKKVGVKTVAAKKVSAKSAVPAAVNTPVAAEAVVATNSEA